MIARLVDPTGNEPESLHSIATLCDLSMQLEIKQRTVRMSNMQLDNAIIDALQNQILTPIAK